MPELLLELLSEEIPARMQRRAADDLARAVEAMLKEAGLAHGAVERWVTPRRLGVAVADVAAATPDINEERRGPKADAPDKAVDGFLRGAGVGRDALEVRDTGKGSYFFVTIDRKGEATADVIARALPGVITGFDWPKSMRWGSGPLRWVRPLHRVLCMFGGDAVPVQLDGVASGTETIGHRFLSPAPMAVTCHADYVEKLRAARVMIDPEERAAHIQGEAERLAGEEGLSLVADAGLVAENAGLVEWPVVLSGEIDAGFMELPREVLSTAMRSHQKYFSLEGPDGALAPRFVLVANMETGDGGARIVAGNQRVLRARLADAAFFWEQDRKLALVERVPALDDLIFHAKLGSVRDKVGRIEALVAPGPLMGAVSAMAGAPADLPALALRAAHLCKADLVTDMVGEFPELQGTMGRYYAQDRGEPPAVADAIAAHYAPLGPSDACPDAPVSVAVALADKIDSLAAFWAIGETPTGSRDPFALRRAALGVIRLVLENDLRLPLTALLTQAAKAIPGGDTDKAPEAVAAALLEFFADRLKVHLRDRGIRHDVVTAVFALGGQDDLWLLVRRAEAVQAWLGETAGEALLAAYRRAGSIVEIEAKKDGETHDGPVDAGKLAEPAETALYERLERASTGAGAALAAEDFGGAISHFAELRGPIDAFFDAVRVNSEDTVLRANRLRLLSRITAEMNRLADFSRIEG